MFMQAIEPSEIRIGRQPFPRCAETQVFYLGYGRNAWNATWINRYDPGSMSFNDADLRTAAEARRVQGSVFRIESLPLFVIGSARGTFGVCEINARSGCEYSDLLERIDRDCPSRFFGHLPRISQNWLLVFKLDRRRLPKAKYKSIAVRSASVGAKYRLRWEQVTPEPRQLFLGFCERLVGILHDQGQRVDRASDPTLEQTEACLKAYVCDDGSVMEVSDSASTFLQIYINCPNGGRHAVMQVRDEFWVTDLWDAETRADGWVQMGPYRTYSQFDVALGALIRPGRQMVPKPTPLFDLTPAADPL